MDPKQVGLLPFGWTKKDRLTLLEEGAAAVLYRSYNEKSLAEGNKPGTHSVPIHSTQGGNSN